jgi:SAM-dependent methyltransferase
MSEHPTERFSNRAEDYRKYRPSYPVAVLDVIVQGLDLGGRVPTVVDLGAGTGISSQLMASAGWRVTAIEPNAEMRGQGKLVYLPGRAEETGLPDGFADIVTAFQAFHWFDPPAALAEFHRILKPGGRVALVWNIRSETDPAMVDYGQVVENYSGVLGQRWRSGGQLLTSPLFDGGRRQTLEHSDELSFEGLLGRARSASCLPRVGKEYEAMKADLQAVFDRHEVGGKIRVVYDVVVFLAERH